MKLQNARGVRDIPFIDQLKRQEIISIMQQTFEQYGFVPLDTPILERYDVLSAKFAAGEESDAMSETYRLQDNGDRELGLRFDLTVPLARYVGMNIDLKLPFKRYQIGKVYRDAPVKAGRYREFTQCDVDIIGAKNMSADATCINVALDVYAQLGVDAIIKVNNRKILSWIIRGLLRVDSEQANSFFMIIDKFDKVGSDGVIQEAVEKGFDKELVKTLLFGLIGLNTGTSREKINFLKEFPSKQPEPKLSDAFVQELFGAINELEELLSYFTEEQLDNNIIFDPFLARGLGYYTGTVFEVYAKENTAIGAIGAGGRYDNLIGGYLEKEDGAYPAVGISFGLDRIVDVLQTLNKKQTKKGSAQVFIIPIGAVKQEAFALANKLRKKGLFVDIDLLNRNVGKNISYAEAYNIPYVLYVGENEFKEGKFKLKNLETKEEQTVTIDELKQVLQ